MKKIKFCSLFCIFCLFFLTACSSNSQKSTDKLETTNKKPTEISTQNYNNTSNPKTLNKKANQSLNKNHDKNHNNTSEKNSVSSNNNMKDKVYLQNNITEKIKNYIINGQENKTEAQKIKWSKTFLNQVDIESLYKQYISIGGHVDDLESFAEYITLNAPIPSNWKELFEKDFYDKYGEKVVSLKYLKDDLYQAYIIKDGSKIPYVVVSSRTGYFHG